MSAARFKSILWLAPALLVLQGCIFSSGGGNGNSGQAYRGFYAFINPTAFSSLSLDSTYQVQWTASDTAGTGLVRLSVYKGDAFVGNLSTSQSGTGAFVWTLPGTRSLGGYRLGSGAGYRLRVTNVADSSKWDFSQPFVIYSTYSGSLEVTAPAQGAKAKLDSTLRITWSVSGNVGPSIGVQLFKDTVLAYTLTASASAATGSYTWASLASSLGSGDDYHIRIFAYGDPSISRTGPAFSISSGYSGSFAFLSPRAEDTLAAGKSAKAVWSVSGNPGTYAQVSLWRDSVLVSQFGYSVALITTNFAPTVDSVISTLPAGLASGRYRFRVASTSDAGIFAFSPAFSVRGTDPDDYEKDDTLALAKPIGTDGKPQQHTLTTGDTDWMRFTAAAGKWYLVGARTSGYLYLDVLDSAGRQLKQSYGSNFQMSFAPGYAGTHYLRAHSTGTAPGPYQVSVLEYDSAGAPAKVAFSAPDEKTTWAAGSSYSLLWSPDSVLFGTSVNLYLYNDTTLVQSIGSFAANGGSYSWIVPSGIYTSGKYRIRMSSSVSSAVFAYSPYFTISGLAPDSYEPDNSRGTAKSIDLDGTAQQRNIAYGDTDWVRFDGVAGKTYLATVNSASASVYLNVTDSTGFNLATQWGNHFSASYTPVGSGKYYVKVQYYSGTGNYTLMLAAYDASQGGVPVKFSAPDSAAVWSSGSAYTATWVADSALFGNYVSLSLYQDNTLLYALASSNSNSGSALLSIPAGLASGKNYRLRIANSSNPSIYGSSAPFTIAGIAPDSLEPNDSIATAKAVVPNSPRLPLSLSYHDKDWFRFTAHAQKLYVIQTASTSAVPTLLRLWPAGGATFLLSGTRASTLDSLNSLAWVAPADGDYFISVEATSTGYYGPYGLEVKEIDPAAYKFTVSAPAEGAGAKIGSSLSILWSDPSSVKGSVDLFLYDGDGVVQTIAANVSNTGSYAWTVPTGLAARADYTVRVISRLSSGISGVSGAFSIGP